MFGLEDQKKKKISQEFIFELEKELKTEKMHTEIKKKVEARIQKIKEILRSGENKSDFDKFGAVLHGYTSLLKIMARISVK